MDKTDRRSVLTALGLIAALAARAPLNAQRVPAPVFNPPSGLVRLRRKLVRDLSDTARITVERVWEVRFEPVDSGYRLRGQQIDVAVEAPATLERLVEIERARVENGFLPMSIDHSGMIVNGPGQSSQQSVAEAMAEAQEQVAASGLTEETRAEAMLFVRQLHARASESLSKLPRDIFLPRQLNYSQEQALALPSGQTGRLVIDFSAQLAPAQDRLLTAERRVITEYAGSTQRSLESWSLAAD